MQEPTLWKEVSVDELANQLVRENLIGKGTFGLGIFYPALCLFFTFVKSLTKFTSVQSELARKQLRCKRNRVSFQSI